MIALIQLLFLITVVGIILASTYYYPLIAVAITASSFVWLDIGK